MGISQKECNIAILYVGIGKYSVFWDDFYKSAEKFLFPLVSKKYFVFTDDKQLLVSETNNTSFVFQEDLDWPGNTLHRYSFFKKIELQLQSFDYFFFFNGNYLFVKPIDFSEMMPEADFDYWTTLVWHKNLEKNSADEFPYDRNPNSGAYIPFKEGKHYYQGGFFGANKDQFWDLVNTCTEWTEKDLAKNIVALWHDESYLNKFMLNKNPKILSTEYGKPEEWKYPQVKALLRDKKKVLGGSYIKSLKNPAGSLKNPITRLLNFFSRLFGRL